MNERSQHSQLADIDHLMAEHGGEKDPWLEGWKKLLGIAARDMPATKEEMEGAVDALLPLDRGDLWTIDGHGIGPFTMVKALLSHLMDVNKAAAVAAITSRIIAQQPWDEGTIGHKADLLAFQAAAAADHRKALAAIKEALGILDNMTGPEVAGQKIDVLRLLADVLQEKGDRRAAAEVMENAMRLAEATESMPLILSVRLELASAYLASGQKERATATVATLMPTAGFGLKPEEEMDLVFGLAGYYFESGDAATAAKVLEDKTAELSAADPGSRLIPDYVERQAVLEARRDNLKGFLKKLARAQELRAAMYGKGSKEYRAAALEGASMMLEYDLLAQARSALATMVRADGDANAVDELAVEALEMFIEVSGKVDAKIDVVEARERLLACRAQLGEDDLPTTLMDEAALAMDYARSGRGEKAKELLAKAEERVPLVDLSVRGEVFLDMAESYHALREWDSMEKAATEAVDCLGRSDAGVDKRVDAMTGLAYAKKAKGRPEEAADIIVRTLDMLRDAYGEDSEQYLDQLQCQEDFLPAKQERRPARFARK
jgi:tetratricopeptide (TPR) repeat protein